MSECHGEPNMHFIRRSQDGLGIEENVVTGCKRCHAEYDDGKYRREHEATIEKYLKSKYLNWDKSKLIYNKWAGFKFDK